MSARPAKPVVLLVVRDPTLRRTLLAELREHCERAFEVRAAAGRRGGERELARLSDAGRGLALAVVDEALGPAAASLLRDADEQFPAAKLALVGEAAFVDQALPADLRIDCRLETSADRDERLFPEVDDLLDEWLRVEQPTSRGIRLIGQGSEPREHRLRDLLLRNRVAYEWLDLERSPDAVDALAEATCPDGPFPVVLLPDGRALGDPSDAELAEALGARTRPGDTVYALVIVGAGPAGLAAAVSSASEGLATLLVEAEATGGQAGASARIENYPGFPGGIRGANLADRMLTQATRFGADLVIPAVARALEREDELFAVHLEDGSVARGRAILLAGGVSYRRLDVPGIERLHGRGVFYGSGLAEARDLQDGHAVVVGGGNSAGQAAMHLARHARRVTLVVRGASLDEGMSEYLVERIGDTPGLDVRLATQVAAVRGRRTLEGVVLEAEGGARESIAAQALYVWIGREPRTGWLPPAVRRDPEGFVLVGPDLLAGTAPGDPVQGSELEHEVHERGREPREVHERIPAPFATSLPGVFAAGDIRHGSVGRVAQAVGDGAACLPSIHAWLAQHPSHDDP